MTGIEDLATIADLERALAGSAERPLLIFKHSTRCSVSARAEREIRRLAERLDPARARVVRVLVVERREVSAAVAERLGVGHESPQAILVVAGEARWHDSHGGVEHERLEDALQEQTAADASPPAAT